MPDDDTLRELSELEAGACTNPNCEFHNPGVPLTDQEVAQARDEGYTFGSHRWLALIASQAAEIGRLSHELDCAVDAREHFKWELHRLTHVVTEPGCEHCAALATLTPKEGE